MSVPEQTTTPPPIAEATPDRTPVYILWALFGVGIFTGGFITIAGVIFAYIKRGSSSNPFERSHCTYAIHTFWWSLLWTLIGILLSFIGIGVFVLGIAAVWYIYRVIKGLVKASEGAAI